MAYRTRIIKHDFFLNETLAELPPETRLLYIGLWVSCDREGRLEDRPKKIKAEIFPYEDYDVDSMLTDLSKGNDPFIIRYSVNGGSYISIPKFTKHQSIHPREKASEIPPCPEIPGNYGVRPEISPTSTSTSTSTTSGGEDIKENFDTMENYHIRLGGLLLTKYSQDIITPPSYSACRKAIEEIGGDINRLTEAIDRMPMILDPKPKNADAIMNRVITWAKNPTWGISKENIPKSEHLTDEEIEYQRAVEKLKTDKFQENIWEEYTSNFAIASYIKDIILIFDKYPDIEKDVDSTRKYWEDQLAKYEARAGDA